ncbi:hypothetical protein AWB69_08938 [Caballeronia udeis]|uniref:Transmembrane protein n=1 Tax=Caballeronia udeis TaxID=1232866 RepID=A0A158JXU4_9BURK|nr:hypothetical protein AWB69_08938 [Caballeronia udeis]
MIKTAFPGRLCIAKTGYVALRPQTARAKRRASAGVSPLSLRSGLPAPRRSVAALPKSLTVQTLCFVVVVVVVVVVVPRKQYLRPVRAGLFFRCAPRSFERAVQSRLQREKALAARRLASVDLRAETPSPVSPSTTATVVMPSHRSRRAGPCCRCATARTHPALESLTAAHACLFLSRDEELRGTAAASKGAAFSAKHDTPGLRI